MNKKIVIIGLMLVMLALPITIQAEGHTITGHVNKIQLDGVTLYITIEDISYTFQNVSNYHTTELQKAGFTDEVTIYCNVEENLWYISKVSVSIDSVLIITIIAAIGAIAIIILFVSALAQAKRK